MPQNKRCALFSNRETTIAKDWGHHVLIYSYKVDVSACFFHHFICQINPMSLKIIDCFSCSMFWVASDTWGMNCIFKFHCSYLPWLPKKGNGFISFKMSCKWTETQSLSDLIVPTLQFFRRVDLLLNVILGTNSSLFVLPLENIFLYFSLILCAMKNLCLVLLIWLKKTFHWCYLQWKKSL